MTGGHILLVLADARLANSLDRNVLRPADFQVTWLDSVHAAENLVSELRPDVVIVGDQLVDGPFHRLCQALRESWPALPVILFPEEADESWGLKALRNGCVDCLLPPLRPDDVLAAVERARESSRIWRRWSEQEAQRTTNRLRNQLDELDALVRVGRSVTSNLELDKVLTTIVEAAVQLTGAEEGNLLLVEEASGELYMRAARNFQEDFVRTFRLPIEDTLAGQVIQSGLPILVDETTPQKIKTAYLVHTLIYVPLMVGKRAIGVLGVDNRTGGRIFHDHHLTLLSALADYAAIAIENARLYTRTDLDRRQLEAVLTQIEDAVIVFDLDDQLLLCNQVAIKTFNLVEADLVGRHRSDLEAYPELSDVLKQVEGEGSGPIEVQLEDRCVLNVQSTVIPEVGRAVTFQEITHFKELDRIKSEFVSTVSHDLRSPLTAIMGYVGLLDRAGPLNEIQQEYINRVQTSAEAITELIDKLLDLGRIEAGFDKQFERVSIPEIINQIVDGLRSHYTEKAQSLELDFQDSLPLVQGNPLRLRQLFENLLSNAIKYTPAAGAIGVQARAEGGQIIIRVRDTGVGIPPADQPYIFDKLYRASNVPEESSGTGLGLSIVKSIVESHRGRIWADSTLGEGTTFTVVLPTMSR